MKQIFPLIASLLLFATACDKIDADASGMYAVTGGSAGTTWADPNQHVYVEKYTGASCIFCPLADETLDAAHRQFGDGLIIISVNDSYTSQGAPHQGEPDFRNEVGKQWEEYAIGTASGIPAALVGRNRATKYTSAMANIIPAIADALQQSATMELGLTATSEGDSITIKFSIHFLTDIDAPLSLTLALTEDSLVYTQSNRTQVDPDYCHNHILRDAATPVWGTAIEADGRSGEKRTATFGYRVPSTLVPAPVLRNCHIVALVSDKASRRVLNAAQCSIDS